MRLIRPWAKGTWVCVISGEANVQSSRCVKVDEREGSTITGSERGSSKSCTETGSMGDGRGNTHERMCRSCPSEQNTQEAVNAEPTEVEMWKKRRGVMFRIIQHGGQRRFREANPLGRSPVDGWLLRQATRCNEWTACRTNTRALNPLQQQLPLHRA